MKKSQNRKTKYQSNTSKPNIQMKDLSKYPNQQSKTIVLKTQGYAGIILLAVRGIGLCDLSVIQASSVI